MNNELTEKLFNKYPSLYKNKENSLMNYGFSCGNGWYQVIDTLSFLLVEQSAEITAVQVKEKFGELRFYLTNIPDNERLKYITGLCQMAELLSRVICDQCGKRGVMNSGPYVCTRCSEHRVDPEEVTNPDNGELLFNTEGLGDMWTDMVRIFYRHIKVNPQNYPNLKILAAHKEKGKLILSITGAGDDKSISGMLAMFEAYTSTIDNGTGEILSKFNA